MLDYFGVFFIIQPALGLITVSSAMILAGLISLAINLYKRSNGSSFSLKYVLIIALAIAAIEVTVVHFTIGVNIISFETVKGMSHSVEN